MNKIQLKEQFDYRTLNKLKAQIQQIKGRKNKKHGRNFWTTEEDDFLVENFGKISKAEIAQRLGRSKNAVSVRINRLGIRDFFQSSEYITLNQMHEIIYKYTLCNERLALWQKLKMPIELIKTSETREYKAIKLENFFEWFKKHIHVIDISLTNDGDFGKNEPNWIKEKRIADKRAFVYTKQRIWTEEEDSILIQLIDEHKTYNEISRALKRTCGAIKKRIQDKKIGKHPKRISAHAHKWSKEEIKTVRKLYRKGYQATIISEELNNDAVSELAVKSLLERYKYFGHEIHKFSRNKGE